MIAEQQLDLDINRPITRYVIKVYDAYTNGSIMYETYNKLDAQIELEYYRTEYPYCLVLLEEEDY
jgi:hypothetical protein